jgi:cytochrome oxidase Cu insertion factor (SCO1/SenC/PrrC family)
MRQRRTGAGTKDGCRRFEERGVTIMKQCLTAVLFLMFSCGVVHAQPGPKIGASLSPTDLGRVEVGDNAPDFTLEDIDGKNISLSDFRGTMKVVLVFYRGHW